MEDAPTPLRILILEDRPSEADLIVGELARAGLNFTWERIEDEEGLRRCLDSGSALPDLILSDFELPQLEGVRALSIVTQRGLAIPFIFVSSKPGEEIAVGAIKRGATDYLLIERIERLGAAVVQALEANRLRARRQAAARTIRKAEVQYRGLVEQIPAITYIVTIGEISRTTYVSPRIEHLLGFTPEEWMADPELWIQQIHPDDRQEVIAAVRQADASGEPLNIQYRVLARDGRMLWIHNQAVILRDEHGLLSYAQGIMSDITELVQREHELKALVSVSAAMRAAAARAEVLSILLDQVLTLLNATAALIEMRDPWGRGTIVELGHGLWGLLTGHRPPSPLGISSQIFSNSRPYLNNDVWAEPQTLWAKMLDDVHAVVGVPLIARDQRIGALWVGRGTEFADTDLRVLTAVADLAANSVQRTTLYEQTERHARQLAAVNRLGQALTQTLELAQIYERLDSAILELWPDAAILFISLYDPNREWLTCVYGRTDRGRTEVAKLPPALLASADQNTQSQVIHTHQPLVVNSVPESVHTWPLELVKGRRDHETQSTLLAPMLAKDRAIGIVHVQSYAAGRFTGSDMELLSFIANTAAIAIENARLFAETRRRLEHVQALHAIDMAITRSTDLSNSLSILLDQTLDKLKVDAAAVFALDVPQSVLRYVAGQGFRSPAVRESSPRLGEGYIGRAVLANLPVHIGHIDAAPAFFERETLMVQDGFVEYYGMPLEANRKVNGLLEVYSRSPITSDAEWISFMEAVAVVAAIAIDNAHLFSSLQESNDELVKAYETTLEGWSRALDLRDRETEGHTRRVAEMTVYLATRMGLGEAEITQIRRGALLHDIGKMGIPDSILQKPGPLTAEEMELMRMHPTYAYNLLRPIKFLRPTLDIPYCHHERWDGAGYPRGLTGEEIPLAARIFAVVDVWDALTSDRRYSPAWPKEAALEYVRRESGRHFDPTIVELFLKLVSEWEEEWAAQGRGIMVEE